MLRVGKCVESWEVCVCVRARARACVHVRACVRVLGSSVHAHACLSWIAGIIASMGVCLQALSFCWVASIVSIASIASIASMLMCFCWIATMRQATEGIDCACDQVCQGEQVCVQSQSKCECDQVWSVCVCGQCSCASINSDP
jgi:hypothetical protein